MRTGESAEARTIVTNRTHERHPNRDRDIWRENRRAYSIEHRIVLMKEVSRATKGAPGHQTSGHPPAAVLDQNPDGGFLCDGLS